MSQHQATATLDGRPLEIVASFGRSLVNCFLQVIDERGDLPFGSPQEPLLDWTDIVTMRTPVAEPGLQLAVRLVDEVGGHGHRRAVKHNERFTASGPPVTLWAD